MNKVMGYFFRIFPVAGMIFVILGGFGALSSSDSEDSGVEPEKTAKQKQEQEKTVEQKESPKVPLRKCLTSLNKEVEKLQKLLTDKFNELKDENEDLKNQLRTQLDISTELADKNTKFDEKTSEIEKEKDALKKEKDALKKENAEVRNTLDKTIKKVKSLAEKFGGQ